MKKIISSIITIIFILISVQSYAAKAKRVKIEDAGGYYASTDVEGALQEIAAAGGTGDITSIFNCTTGACNSVSLGASHILDATLGTLRLPTSDTLPVSCSVGDGYVKSDAPAGQKLHICESINTWVVVGSAGSIAWGAITGNILDQTDLQSALNTKYDSLSDLQAAVINDFHNLGGVDAVGATTLTGLNDVNTTASMDAGNILISDGTNFDSLSVSGEITLGSDGSVGIARSLEPIWTKLHTFNSTPIVPTETYGPSWSGSNQVPTKHAVYEKIESINIGGGGSGSSTITGLNDVNTTASMGAGNILISDGTNFDSLQISGDVTMTSAGVATVGDDSHDHVITNIDAFTEAQLETQLSNVANVIVSTEIDTFAGLNAIVADETLVNTNDNQTLINKTIDGDDNTIRDVDDDEVNFDDSDNNYNATTTGAAIEELDDVNGSGPNAPDGKVDWSQLVNVPSGFADGSDDGLGGGSGSSTITGLSDVNSAGNYAKGNLLISDGTNFDTIQLSGDMTVNEDGLATIQPNAVSAAEMSDFGTLSKTLGNILVSDGGDFESRTVSGDATVDSGGVLTIQPESVDISKMVSGPDGHIYVSDGAGAPQSKQLLTAATSAYVRHEHGGLEADISSYDGIIGISGGSVYQQTGSNTQIIIFDGSGPPTTASISGDANMTSSGDLTVLSGDSATAFFPTGTLEPLIGGTGLSIVTNNSLLVGNGSFWEAKVIPSCSNSTTQKLLFNSSTREFSCGTDQNNGSGGGSQLFTWTPQVQSGKLNLDSLHAPLIDGGNERWAMLYDADTIQTSSWMTTIDTYSGGGFSGSVGYTAFSATTGSVTFNVYAEFIGDGDSIDYDTPSIQTANVFTATVPGTAGHLDVITGDITNYSGTIAVGKHLILHIGTEDSDATGFRELRTITINEKQ